AIPISAAVSRDKQASTRTRIDDVRMTSGPGNNVRPDLPAQGVFQTQPGAAAVETAVDPAASSREQMASAPHIHIQGEYVGVFLHADGNTIPAFAAIDSLPREVWGTCVKRVGIRRIECERDHRARRVSSGQRKHSP